MLLRSRSLETLRRCALASAPLFLLTAAAAAAQAPARWNVVPEMSLAWWQVNPHLNHLWATSCPGEPSWRPGEGRSGGWSVGRQITLSKTGYAATSDTVHVPLYPRRRARPLCGDAVQGWVTLPDTVTWKGARGEIVVRAEALVGGEERRDAYARDAVLETKRYPTIRFELDSLVDMKERSGIYYGMAAGQFTLHGVTRPIRAGIRGWPEDDGTFRMHAKFHIPAADMTDVYGLSSYALGLGVGVKVFLHLFMGADVVLSRADQ